MQLRSLDTVVPHFDEGGIITIDADPGHTEDKSGPVH